jgi:hypothetical protein
MCQECIQGWLVPGPQIGGFQLGIFKWIGAVIIWRLSQISPGMVQSQGFAEIVN